MATHSTTPLIAIACAMSVACRVVPTAPTSISTDDAVLVSSIPTEALTAVTHGTGPSMDELVERGWECHPSRYLLEATACSAPSEGFPVAATPPPPDRRAAFTLLLFVDGRFAGTLLLIRSDLYQGQRCSSTGEPYAFNQSVGYYECFRPAGRRAAS